MHENTILLRRTLTAVTLALALSPGAALAADFDDAVLAYEVNHWAKAYTSFAALADQGHAEAARLALQMWRYGPPLYGLNLAASDGQVDRWSRLCACTVDSQSPPAQLARRPPATRR